MFKKISRFDKSYNLIFKAVAFFDFIFKKDKKILKFLLIVLPF
jgi:hypothetical protein